MLRSAVALVVAALTLTSCGSAHGKPAAAVRAPTPVAIDVQTFPKIDDVLKVTLSADAARMADLSGYATVSCETAPSGDIPRPACGHESDGQLVDVLPRLGCKPGWLRPDQVSDAYGAALGGKPPRLVAVYTPTAHFALYGSQHVAVVATGSHSDGLLAGMAFYFRDGKIVAIEDDCVSIVELLSADRVEWWIVPPRP